MWIRLFTLVLPLSLAAQEIQPSIAPLSLGSLAAVAKSSGASARFLNITRRAHFGDLAKVLADYRPQLVYVTSHCIAWLPQLCRLAKRIVPDVLIVCGGVHATLFPTIIIDVDGLDAVCIGEGEEPLTELLDRLSSGRDPAQVDSLWVKRGNTVMRNRVRPLLENLDALPFPDREMFGMGALSYGGATPFLFARGCGLRGSIDGAAWRPGLVLSVRVGGMDPNSSGDRDSSGGR